MYPNSMVFQRKLSVIEVKHLYMSTFWNCVMEAMNLELNMSTRNLPQTERVNRELGNILRIYTGKNLRDWSKKLDTAEFAYNSTYNETIHMSPFEADTGSPPRKFSTFSEMQLRIHNDNALQEKWKSHVNNYKIRFQKLRKDKNITMTNSNVEFESGEWVILDRRVFGIPSKYAKLRPVYSGPYKVIRRFHEDESIKHTGRSAYEIDSATTLNKRKYNERSLRKYHFQESYEKETPDQNNNLDRGQRL